MRKERPEGDDFVKKTEMMVDTRFLARDVQDIEHAQKLCKGQGCQCNSCLAQAEREGNYAIEDIQPEASGKLGFRRVLNPKTGRFKLEEYVDE